MATKLMMMRKLIFSLMLIVLNVASPLAWAEGFDHSHSKWEKILSQYVVDQGSASQVRYAELKKDSVMFDGYLGDISSVTKQQYDSWNREQQLAFLINAYNAFTLKLIIKNYPVDSIKDIGGFFTSAWKVKFFNLLGEEQYLDYIEHTLIRGDTKFSEPRIHFAVVCASIGCPKLQSKAFTADNLEELLERGSKDFLTDKSRNRYNVAESELYLSKIFKWYGDDFVKKHGSAEQFVAPYVTSDVKEQTKIINKQTEINYLDYNWSLNDTK